MQKTISFILPTKEEKKVSISIEVTEPNEFGVFKIITEIGNETPVERLTTINNTNIVESS